MSVALDTCWEICNTLTSSTKYVDINEKKISETAKLIANSFSHKAPWGAPNIFDLKHDFKLKDGQFVTEEKFSVYQSIIAFDFIANSINYQYWYGRDDLRPGDSGASKMYFLLENVFKTYCHSGYYRIACEFIKELCFNRFPCLEQRINHITELFDLSDSSSKYGVKKNFVYEIYHLVEHGCLAGFEHEGRKEDVRNALDLLISAFPGYSNDLLLKRASLFFMMLYRRMGWFKDSIHLLPIPADYQVPKMLRHFGCISYVDSLSKKISNHELIPSGSLEEAEIRASSIIACKLLAEESGLKMCDIDTFLWGARKECNEPFHLTITTDY